MSYEQVYNDEWFDLRKTPHISCCDCGLVHEIKVRVRKGKVEVQLNRDNRRTGQIRRWAKAKRTKT
jgi:hypothetical protein